VPDATTKLQPFATADSELLNRDETGEAVLTLAVSTSCNNPEIICCLHLDYPEMALTLVFAFLNTCQGFQSP
jgi:hypothetical protein